MSEATIIQKPRQTGIVRTLAEIVSYIFHPIFMPTVMAVVLYLLYPAPFKSFAIPTLKLRLATIILLTVFFPLFSILLMKPLGFIQSIHLRTQKDRIIPLITTMIFYFWAYQVFSHMGLAQPGFNFGKESSISHLEVTPAIINILLLGSFWGIIALFMISIFFKISMHTSAAGGMIGIIIVLVFTSPINLLAPLFGAVIVAGMIGTARLVVQEHTPAEVFLGYAVGLGVQLGAWAFLS